MKLSVVIPILNERKNISASLLKLAWIKVLGHELIVVDGGSDDGSLAEASQYASLAITSTPGRACQMNAGAQQASGELLVFLHIDTVLTQECIVGLCQRITDSGQIWGRFDVSLSGKHIMFRVIEKMMNWRSRLTGIATGDQAIFVMKDTFLSIAGYADIPLMEDIEISRRLKCMGAPLCLSEKVVTSSRRWEKKGILPTIIFMWRLRFAYWRGVDAQLLADQYYR